MAWLSRVNFVSSDTLSFTDINNLGNDIRAWGDNVNGGGYTLSNVAISASSGTMATVTGGTGAASTLTLRSTSGVGTSDAIVFVTGNAGANEALRLSSSGSANFGKIWASGAQATGNVALSRGDLVSFGTSLDGAALTWDVQTTAGNASVMARLRPRWRANLGYALDVFAGAWNNAYDPGSAVATFQSTGNVGIGTASPVLALHVVGTQGGPATSGTTPTGTARFVTVNSAMDIGSRSNGNTWMQVTDQTNLALSYNLELNPNGGNVGIGTSPAYQLQLSTDSAAKPTTNTWTIASDARLKTVLGDYEKGLDAICALRPVRYKYNGFGGMVADGKEHISIVAQEAQEVFPECIGTFQGKLHGDDEQETELLNYNGHAITFALINAIKELKAKIDIFEARN
jgi:hypothetical protein